MYLRVRVYTRGIVWSEVCSSLLLGSGFNKLLSACSCVRSLFNDVPSFFTVFAVVVVVVIPAAVTYFLFR